LGCNRNLRDGLLHGDDDAAMSLHPRRRTALQPGRRTIHKRSVHSKGEVMKKKTFKKKGEDKKESMSKLEEEVAVHNPSFVEWLRKKHGKSVK
jgi:hypothetical protein